MCTINNEDGSRCRTVPSFGLYGKRTHCAKHRLDNMEDNMTKKCISCKTNASFGLNGKRTHCDAHKEPGMVSSDKRKCHCGKRPTFGLVLGGKPTRCSDHTEEGMIDIIHGMCEKEDCYIRPTYSSPDTLARFCRLHKLPDMVDVNNKKQCEHLDCNKRPNFGMVMRFPTHCADHKDEKMMDVKSKKCTNCNLFNVNKKNNFLCMYCSPTPRMESKERKIKALLEKNGFTFAHNKQIKNDCCLKYRPDFLFDCGTYFVVLECDEYAHAGYEQECETVRMNNISTGLGLPTLWIRYNPDLPRTSDNQRHTKLIKTLKDNLALEMLLDPAPIYLFYPST